MKVRLGILIASLATLLLPVALFGIASAQSFQANNNVSVGQNQIVNSSFYGAGNTVDIAGTVNGDVYCGGQSITISGTVTGDVLCAGQSIDISGVVHGSLRLAGQSIMLSGKIRRNVSVVAQSYNASSSSDVMGDVTVAADTITVNGSIGRDAVLNGSTVTVNSQVGRNIHSDSNDLSLGGSAVVGGDLTFRGNHPLNRASTAKVNGKVNQTSVPPKKHTIHSWVFVPGSLGGFVYILLSLLFSSLILVLIFGRRFQEFSEVAVHHYIRSTLFGLLASFALPAISIILLVSIIGAPLGLISIVLTALIFLLSMPFAAYYIGRSVVSVPTNSIEIMLIGTLILVIVSYIPIVGPIFDVLAVLLGVGIIIQNIFRRIPPAHYQVK